MNPSTSLLPTGTDTATPREHPLEYDAFRQLCERPYLEYARLRTGDGTRAARSVSRAFADLCAHWSDMLRSACPAAYAWEILNAAVDGEDVNGTVGSPRLPCHLTAAQADAVRLHHHLGLNLQKTAALLGTDDQSVRAVLRSAARTRCTALSCLLDRT
ncbi:hypothetical protein [Streptomyces microflavus]|uniref:hypothetical protein n=1 Tax=Streptomyces microflavus TaxID=1919 RepID=UPI00369911A4